MMRKAVWVPVVLIITLLLAACGPARTPAPAPGGGETFMLALPRLVIDVDASGNPVIFGLNAADVGRFIGADVSSLRVDPATVKRMTTANIQHIEMRQVGPAMALWVNAKPMPHIGWDDQSLQQATDVARAFGALQPQNADTVRRLLPLVRRLGIDVALRFPRPTGAAEIPLVDLNTNMQISPSNDPPSAIVQFEVKYDATGAPAIMGISSEDLRGLGVNLPGRLDAATLARLQQSNIQNMELRSKNDGLRIYANGNVLPNLIWDDTLLKNATDVYALMNPDNANLAVITLLGPWMSKLDADVLIHFPVASGQTALPANMHP